MLDPGLSGWPEIMMALLLVPVGTGAIDEIGIVLVPTTSAVPEGLREYDTPFIRVLAPGVKV